MKYTCFLLFCLTLPSLAGTAGFGEGVVEIPLAKSDHITIRLMFRAGAINDPAAKLGLTNLTANLMAGGGTSTYTKAELDEILYPLAVGIRTTVGKEVTTFTTVTHKDNLETAYKIFSDLILNPRFDSSDFARIKKNAVKTVTQDMPNNNDEVFSKRALDSLMFANHPYGHLVQGSAAGLESITLDDVKAHYKAIFTHKNLMIGLAGGYDKAFKSRIQKDLKALPKGSDNKVSLPKVPMPNGIQALVVSKEKAFGSAVFMGYPMDIDRSNDDFAALLVAASYLGEHRKSYGRLYSEMRSKRSMNYGDYAYVEWYQSGHVTQLPFPGFPRSQNFFSIWLRPVQTAEGVKNIPGLEETVLGNGHYAIRKSLRELEKLASEGLKAEDFERTRKFMMGYMKLYIQSQTNRLGFLMDSRFYGRNDYINEMSALIGKLTLKQTNAVIAKYLQAKNMYVAVITDDSEADLLAKSMKTNGSAPVVYKPVVRSGLESEILEEDKIVDAYKLNVTDIKVIKNDTLFK